MGKFCVITHNSQFSSFIALPTKNGGELILKVVFRQTPRMKTKLPCTTRPNVGKPTSQISLLFGLNVPFFTGQNAKFPCIFEVGSI